MLRAVPVAALIAAMIAAPTVAYACLNEVQLRGEKAVRILAKAEKHLDAAQYRQARSALHGYTFEDQRLRDRARDYNAVIALRVRTPKDDVGWLVRHFEQRLADKANKKNLRLRAWLAEAHAAAGQDDLAREILLELKRKDLMPDAFAYLTLAQLSTGTEREQALAACVTKAKAKSICKLPARKGQDVAAKRAS